MKTRQPRNYSLRTIVGLVLTGICAAHALVNVFVYLALGNGMTMLAQILALVALVGLLVTTAHCHDSDEMAQWPAIWMCLYIGSNLLRIFGEHWSYVLMILPLAAMILLLVVFIEWGVMGIAAGCAMIVLNLVIGMLSLGAAGRLLLGAVNYAADGRLSSFYVASLLVNNNSLMGIACICLFCAFPQLKQTVSTNPQGNNPWSNGGFF